MSDRHVLIADDDQAVINEVRTALEKQGYAVTTTGNGIEALELISTDPPEGIILDLVMPGMNGLEVCRRIKSHARLQEIPVILVTSITRNSGLADGFWRLGTDADAFLSKPFDVQALIGRLEQLIQSRQTCPRT